MLPKSKPVNNESLSDHKTKKWVRSGRPKWLNMAPCRGAWTDANGVSGGARLQNRCIMVYLEMGDPPNLMVPIFARIFLGIFSISGSSKIWKIWKISPLPNLHFSIFSDSTMSIWEDIPSAIFRRTQRRTSMKNW